MAIPVKSSSSGLSLPVLGLGTWGMGGRSYERDPANDDDRDIKAIRHAISKGIMHIDTAEIYAGGHAEALVGKAVRDLDRTKYTVATKAAPQRQSYDELVASCRESLVRLGMEYVDLYYLHTKSKDVPFAETARALNVLHADGLIRHIGICNFKSDDMQRLQDLLHVPIAVNQSQYSVAFRGPASEGLIEHCRNKGALFAAWRPLMWHYPDYKNPPKGNAWEPGVYPVMDEIAASLGKTNVQVALNWLISQPGVIALVKSSTPSNIDEMAGAAGWIMPENLADKIRSEFPDQR